MSIDRQFNGRDLPLTPAPSPQAGRRNVDVAGFANQAMLSGQAMARSGQPAMGGYHESSPRMAGRRWPAGRMTGIFFGRNQ